MLNSPRAWQLMCALLVAMVLGGGCAPSRDQAAPPATESAPASTKPSPTPSPSASPLQAADGSNYEACADGVCEVAVSRPVTLRLGGPAGAGSTLVIREVLDDGLDIDLTLAGGGGGDGTLKFKGACGTITRFNTAGG